MITPIRPDDAAIRSFLERQRGRPFSHPHVGASGDGTRRAALTGYAHDHDRAQIGSGEAAWQRARAALTGWKMFALEGVRLCWPDAPIEVGTLVAVLARVPGLWTLNACRIAHLVEGSGEVERFGFAYGTVAGHAMHGEEVFAVEWRRDDDTVWWERRAFSRPHHPLVWLGRPTLRRMQARFGVASVAAMTRAAAGSPVQS